MPDYLMPDQFVKKTEELLRQVPVNFRGNACDKALSLFKNIDYICMPGKDVASAKDRLNSKIENIDTKLGNLKEMLTDSAKRFGEHRHQIQNIYTAIDDLSDEVTDLDV